MLTTTVIIINWNGEQKLPKYLPQILQVKGVNEFIVADDASTDRSVEILKEIFLMLKVFQRDKNDGFSSNANFGVSHAQGELVFLLNADAVPKSDCLEQAIKHFSDSKVFSVSCNTGGNWSWAKFESGFFWHFLTKEKVMTHQTLWARGGSGIFRKSIWDKLGGMDELFDPFYEEDMDLGYRATKRGYKNLWVKECVVKLPEDKGVIAQHNSKQAYSTIAQRNQLLFIWKNITSEKLFAEHKKALSKKLVTNPKYLKVFLAAIKKWPQVRQKRQIEIKEAVISDEAILDMFLS